MKLSLVDNCWWNSPVDPVNGIRAAKEIGFDSYDIYPLNIAPQAKKAQMDALREVALPCSSVLVAANGLTDIVDEVKKFSVNYVKRQADVGCDFGAHTLVLVLGDYPYNKKEFDPKLQWNSALEGVREIADYCKGLDIKIALEFVPYKYYILTSVDEMVRFIDDADHPSVMANVDVSHLYLMGDQPASVARLKDKIINVHFSDCDGKEHGDLPPGRGVVPLKEYLRALRDIGTECPVSIELEWPDDPNTVKAWVTEAYEKTAQMMKDLNLRA